MTVTAIVHADRHVRIDVSFDAEHIPADLHVPSVTGLSPTNSKQAAEHLQRLLLATGELSVRTGPDARPIMLEADEPTIDVTEEPNIPENTRVDTPEPTVPADPSRKGTHPRIRFSLFGRIPASAASISWRCSLPVGQYLYRVRHSNDADAFNQWLDPGTQSETFPLWSGIAPSGEAGQATLQVARPQTRAGVIADYLRLGYTHILPLGADHILFVLGLFFLGQGVRPLLAQVTAFTVAHSLTLALASCDVVRLPPTMVEPLIAASIAFIAVENILSARCTPWRPAVVFAFGLLHGLGFAGVLQELGIPNDHFIPALVSFNVGVEFGQLTVLAAAFVAVGLWHGSKPWYRARVAIPASVLIALTGIYWTADRLVSG